MNISYKWLKTYVNLPTDDVDVVGKMLTSIGLEVEHIAPINSLDAAHTEGLVVGKVVHVEPHPNADRLRLTRVDIGQAEPLRIVCGAPNVALGQTVVVATIGTTLHPINNDPFKIKKSKIRGEDSEGMICAESEIGLSSNNEGIMVLDDHIAAGTAYGSIINTAQDYLIEIGLTPNRSDAMCHIGVAADLAAAFQFRTNYPSVLHRPDISDFRPSAKEAQAVSVEVSNAELCPRYSGVSIVGVKVQPSPDWLVERLAAIGIRSINNIVDITNFVLHETGQPLHAFDADKIGKQKIVVTTLPANMPFVALDGIARELSADDLMICDGDLKPLCIAGVFGGLNSGVTDTTTNIFLESAYFNATSVRKTATRHNLRTEAAVHFEKGTDPNNTVYALKRAALLIAELGNGTIASEVIDYYPNPILPKSITLRYAQVRRITGCPISNDEIKQLLAALQMPILKETTEAVVVSVPTNKAEVLREIDVIEELLRIYGFDRVPVDGVLKSTITLAEKPDVRAIQNQIADILVASGYSEAMGLSLHRRDYYPEDDASLVQLQSSVNTYLTVMRQEMLLGTLEIVAHNLNHKNNDLRLFEFGKTYLATPTENKATYSEQSHLTLLLTGNYYEVWRQKSSPFSYFDLKEVVEKIWQRLGIGNTVATTYRDKSWEYGQQYSTSQGQALATLGKVQPELLKKYDIKQDVWFADIYWEHVIDAVKGLKVQYTELPKFPAVRRDLALLLDTSVTYQQIEDLAYKTTPKLLKQVNLFDVFEDEQKLGKGKKSYAVSFMLQADKTLADAEINAVMQQLITVFSNQLKAEIR